MVFEKVKAILADQLDIAEDDIQMESRMIDDLKADSLDIVELIMDLEAEFDVEVADEDVAAMETIQDVVEYIEKAIA